MSAGRCESCGSVKGEIVLSNEPVPRSRILCSLCRPQWRLVDKAAARVVERLRKQRDPEGELT